jgi:hypothetical protein
MSSIGRHAIFNTIGDIAYILQLNAKMTHFEYAAVTDN